MVLATGVDADGMVEWAWRIPFLMAAPLGVIGLYIRMTIEDSPAFKRVARNKEVAKVPIAETFQNHWKALLRTIGLRLVSVAGYFVVYVYMSVYIEKNLGHGLGVAAGSTAVALCVSAATMPLIAWLIDVVGRRTMYITVTALLLVTVWPLITLMASPFTPLVFLVHSLLGIMVGGLMPIVNATIAELFPTETRLTGLGLGFNVANVLAGGTAPYIVATLGALLPGINVPVLYLAFFAVVGILSALTLKPTARIPLAELDGRLAR
jgi:MHS family proline/betaine transporter-like MFS transporter